MRYISTLSHKNLAGKTCLVRANLDIKNPRADSLRIEKAVPTITFLFDHGAKPIIISHRGRPENQISNVKHRISEFSLAPAIKILSQKVGQKLEWRENLRFDPREQNNNLTFAKELAAGADIYVNDDFATSHHAAASLVAITQFLPSYAGLLLEDEIKNLSAVRDKPQKPLVIIIGGIKIEDKQGIIAALKTKADWFLLGSAYTMLRELLPQDAHLAIPTDGDEDIGKNTIKAYEDIIARAKTIIWSGPLGKIEDSAHTAGSETIARAIIKSKAFSVVGGGDTIDFLVSHGLINKFNFASTGGGAMLAFLAGKPLPALAALDNCPFI